MSQTQEKRVRVYGPDQIEVMGDGTYLGETTLNAEVMLGFLEGPLEGMALVIADAPTPKIRLDSGKIIYGCMCWWEELEPLLN